MATVKYFITSEDKSQSGLASAKKGLEQLGKESEKTGATGVKQFDLMGAALKGGLILAIGAATKAIVDFGKASVESFRVNEPIMIRLAAAARNAGSSFSEMSGFLAELGKTTLTTGTRARGPFPCSGKTPKPVLLASFTASATPMRIVTKQYPGRHWAWRI